ncbi:hypothetical protein AAGG74_17950 [Bacillus mexicanus]|uniref:hypothetical protein n=1 Tax=Bacillus mexicanus TaxID=2834415 RepID=UPI003D24AE7B
MNELGIRLFKEKVEVGDRLSVSFEDDSYSGIVETIGEKSVTLRNDRVLDLFEALTTPAILEVFYNKIWFYCVTNNEGKNIAV